MIFEVCGRTGERIDAENRAPAWHYDQIRSSFHTAWTTSRRFLEHLARVLHRREFEAAVGVCTADAGLRSARDDRAPAEVVTRLLARLAKCFDRNTMWTLRLGSLLFPNVTWNNSGRSASL